MHAAEHRSQVVVRGVAPHREEGLADCALDFLDRERLALAVPLDDAEFRNTHSCAGFRLLHCPRRSRPTVRPAPAEGADRTHEPPAGFTCKKNYESGEVPYTACAPHPESGRHVPQGRSSDLLPAARLPALRGAVAKSVRTDAELTATGIVPESHRSSLFIPHRRRPAGKPCTKTKIGHAAGSSNGAPRF